jgi:hypothetical protein
MVRKSDKAGALAVAAGALGAIAALTLGAPPVQADPDVPPPPLPLPGEQSISTQAAAGDPALPAEVLPAQPPAEVLAAQPPAEVLPAPPAEVPHLSSPENLPPGTTDVPLEPDPGRGASYLRDLWQGVQNQEISGKEAMIFLLTQRPLDPNAVPTNGLPAGPQAPLSDAPPLTGAPPADAPLPAAPLTGAPPADAPLPAAPLTGAPPADAPLPAAPPPADAPPPGPVLPELAPPPAPPTP